MITHDSSPTAVDAPGTFQEATVEVAPRGASAALTSRIGDVLNGAWRLDAVIGVGASSAVYAATHVDGRRAAIKLLHPEYAFIDKLRFRLDREAHLMDALEHPGAVRILEDDMSDSGDLFLVMELLHGKTLDDYLADRGGRLPISDALRIALQILDVLVVAHAKGIVHRDIKLSNVFVTQTGRVKLLDFGVARCRGGNDHFRTGPGAVIGTPAYMAPEQALGLDDEVDAQSDLWSVGATLFRMLTGLPVHYQARTLEEEIRCAATERAPKLESLLLGADGALSELLDRALAFEKRARWHSAQEMQAAILRLPQLA